MPCLKPTCIEFSPYNIEIQENLKITRLRNELHFRPFTNANAAITSFLYRFQCQGDLRYIDKGKT